MKNIKKNKYYNSSKRGYAILFAVILVSIISAIALGLSNTTYKQLIITSVAKDSEMAFYQSDIATECGLYLLYLDNTANRLTGSPTWNCGVTNSGSNISLNINQDQASVGIFDITPVPAPSASSPYFTININKNKSLISLRGYNVYNSNNFRKVERAIQISY